MGYMNLVITFMLQGMHLSHCFTINISGETYIEPGVPYNVTCTVSEFLMNRRTSYSAIISNDDITEIRIIHVVTGECVYRLSTGTPLCPSILCSCDTDGLATHWIYNTPTDLASSVAFRCSSKNNEGILTNSASFIPAIPNGPGSSISFNPANESITKILGQSLGPIVCSAQCNPPCKLHWIKTDGTVVNGSNITIPSLSKNDNGTFTCHAGNGYGNNATKNLLLTVNYGPEYVTLSPSTMTYTVTEGDTIPSINCTASCRPQCTFMWTGPNVPNGTTNDLYLQNINRNQKGTSYCTATNEVGRKMSSNVVVDIKYGPGLSISFDQAGESITKIEGQRLGPILCSAQCNPPCQFYWIKPDGTVVDGSNLTIPNLSKNDHGTFTCHTGNGYDNNGTKNLNVTVNYGPESVTLSPPTISYTVTEGDTLPSISCTASCRPQCTFMWTGPNVLGGTTNDLYLQNITRNQNRTFYCTAINNVGSKMSSNVEVDVRYGPRSSVSFNPANQSITKILGQRLDPIACSAQCNPQCHFHWIKPDGTVVDEAKLEIPSLSKDDHGTFTCHTGNGYGNNATKNLSVIVNYGPESVTLSPPNTTYTVTEGDTIPSISCTASCRPQCTFMWTEPNVPGGTTNDLYLQNINRNQKGTFYCTVTNEVGSKVTYVEVDVQYQAKVENVDINTNNTVDENSTVKFSCLLEGNPAPTVTWSLNGKILQTTEGSTTKSSYIVNSARCNTTGRYICAASNIIGNSTKQQMLYVTCHPRNAIILDTTIAIKGKNGALNITVPIISYPHPNLIRWTFIQNGATNLIDVDNKYINTTYGVYQHVSQLIKDGLIESEYGTYSINVSNDIGPYFQHDFKVVAETIPDPPSNVSAVCNTSPFSTIISWRSEFDGGRAQTFHVWFKICCENVREFVPYSDANSDPGRNKYVSVEITSLQAATPYIFYVSSSNDYGSSKSTKVFCNTTAAQMKTKESSTSNVLLTAGISSLIIGLLAIVFVIAFVVICRRRLQKREQMRTNVYTECTTYTNNSPVATDNYDSLNTTAIGPVAINETQADSNIITYEECLPVTNIDHTYNSLNIQPREKKKLKKKEEIYENMKI